MQAWVCGHACSGAMELRGAIVHVNVTLKRSLSALFASLSENFRAFHGIVSK